MNEWRTKEEIEHIRAAVRKRDPAGRRAFLRRYLVSMPNRRRWGRIEPEVVEAYVRLELGKGGLKP